MGIEKKVLMVGLGPVVDGEWKPRVFTRAGARKYMGTSMTADLRKNGFVPLVVDCGGYWRGNYAGMREARRMDRESGLRGLAARV